MPVLCRGVCRRCYRQWWKRTPQGRISMERDNKRHGRKRDYHHQDRSSVLGDRAMGEIQRYKLFWELLATRAGLELADILQYVLSRRDNGKYAGLRF